MTERENLITFIEEYAMDEIEGVSDALKIAKMSIKELQQNVDSIITYYKETHDTIISLPPLSSEAIERTNLRNRGYYMDNLWHIHDVQGKLEAMGYKPCEKKIAHHILKKTFNNEATIDQIWLSMEYAIEDAVEMKFNITKL